MWFFVQRNGRFYLQSTSQFLWWNQLTLANLQVYPQWYNISGCCCEPAQYEKRFTGIWRAESWIFFVINISSNNYFPARSISGTAGPSREKLWAFNWLSGVQCKKNPYTHRETCHLPCLCRHLNVHIIFELKRHYCRDCFNSKCKLLRRNRCFGGLLSWRQIRCESQINTSIVCLSVCTSARVCVYKCVAGINLKTVSPTCLWVQLSPSRANGSK